MYEEQTDLGQNSELNTRRPDLCCQKDCDEEYVMKRYIATSLTLSCAAISQSFQSLMIYLCRMHPYGLSIEMETDLKFPSYNYSVHAVQRCGQPCM